MTRQIATALLRPGMHLGCHIYDARGRILLRRGVVLRDSYIARLQANFGAVYIEEEGFDDVEVPEVLSRELREAVQRSLSAEWTRMRAEASFERVSFSRNFARALRENMRSVLAAVQSTTCIREDLASLAGYDNLTYVHSLNVAIYSLTLGVALGLPDSMLLDLGIGALLHDVGKMWVPTEVLNKAEKLTAEETAIMQTHTELGHELLIRQPELSYQIAHCAFQHHERLNGTGYPRRLQGPEIHLYAKIVAVADVYDAMVINRPYRPGMAPAEAMEYLFSMAGSQFDLEIVSQFSRRVSIYPVGSQVLLSDGRVGVVVSLHDQLPSRPVIRILSDRREEQVDVDLAERLNLTIVQSGGSTILEAID